jgi:NAD(P)-dependent dehydrogenase (short-subunit alcohol dehydrogenase family)
MSQNGNPLDISGKTAIVTGASSGLGVVFAEGLARAGANVVIAARRVLKLEKVAAAIEAAGGSVLPVTCDVGDQAAVRAMVDAAVERFGRLDVMVCNAGTAMDGGPSPERLPRAYFDHAVRTNLNGTWYCCQAAARKMLADGRGGSIITMSSVLGLAAAANFPMAYMSTKAAIINMTRAMAASWADRGIRVNALAPGWFPSEMTDAFFAMPAFRRRIVDQTPMGRLGDPSELIGPLLFLASDASSFVTGHTLVVDGGISTAYGQSRPDDEIREAILELVPGGMALPITPDFPA